MPQMLIAASSSASGKTTLTLGLLRSLHRRGLRPGAAKCGPDFIDTAFHAMAAGGRESVNLDLYLGSEECVRREYAIGAHGAGVMVTEGAMGLFDGYDMSRGSAAHVAATLGLPVVLVVNAAAMAFSTAATIIGFARFMPGVRVAAVVFNRVASASHRATLAAAAEVAGVECVGYMGRTKQLSMPSRHLGLAVGDGAEMEAYIEAAAAMVEQEVDINRLLELTSLPAPPAPPEPTPAPAAAPELKVAVASDAAFSFIYPANMRALTQRTDMRVTLRRFSPLADETLPPDTDLLYLPGGYPELYARELEANRSMRRSIGAYCLEGGRTLAECGGMIYLTRDIDGAAMCGVLPASCTMADARLRLGYRTVSLDGGLTVRGHEFHYSRLRGAESLPSMARITDARGTDTSTALYRVADTLAGYTHLYWPETDILNLWQ